MVGIIAFGACLLRGVVYNAVRQNTIMPSHLRSPRFSIVIVCFCMHRFIIAIPPRYVKKATGQPDQKLN